MLLRIQLFVESTFAIGKWNIADHKLLENAGENTGDKTITLIGNIVISPTPANNNIFLS
jgi:hypothetical protein